MGLSLAATTTHGSPGSKSVSGERATSTSFENTHRWPARRRASSPRFRYNAGYSMGWFTVESFEASQSRYRIRADFDKLRVAWPVRGWHTFAGDFPERGR